MTSRGTRTCIIVDCLGWVLQCSGVVHNVFIGQKKTKTNHRGDKVIRGTMTQKDPVVFTKPYLHVPETEFTLRVFFNVGIPWFEAGDLGRCMGLSISRITYIIRAWNNTSYVVCCRVDNGTRWLLSEQGVYLLLIQCHAARTLCDWLFLEVIPALHKGKFVDNRVVGNKQRKVCSVDYISK